MHSHAEMTWGFACNVAGHTGILGSVTELSLVDLQVTPTGKNAHTSGGLCKHLCVHFKSLQGTLRVYFFIWLISNLQGLAIFEPGQSGRWNSIGLALQSHLSVQQHGHILSFTLPGNIRRNCNRTEMATDLLLYHNYLDWSSKIECKMCSSLLLDGTHHALELGTPCHHLLLDCWLSSCIYLCPPTECKMA